MTKTKFSPAKALLAVGSISLICAGLITPATFAEGEERTEAGGRQNFTNCLVRAYNNEHPDPGNATTLTDAQLASIKDVRCALADGDYFFIHSLDKLTALESINVDDYIMNTSVDFSSNTNLEAVILTNYNYNGESTEITSITFPSNPKIDYLELTTKINTLNLSGLTKLEEIDIHGSNEIILPESNSLESIWTDANELDVSKNPNLISLNIFGKNFTGIDLSKNTKLEILGIQGTKISSIDLSKNANLKSLSLVMDEDLTKLDVSANKKLEHLAISGDNIKNLDLSNNPALIHFIAEDSGLETVKFYDGGSKLEYIYLSGNDITTLDLSKVSSNALIDIVEEDGIESINVPESWKEKYTEEEIREILNLDEDQEINIQYGPIEDSEKGPGVPDTGIAAVEMAKYVAIVALPAILILASTSKRVIKRQSKKVRFSR